MSPIVPRPAAAIFVVTEDGRVLVGERSGVPFLSGFVAFPGGCVEDADGGDPRTAVLRELAEETGLVLAAGGRLVPVPAELRARPPAELYRALSLAPPPPEELIFAGRWITPDSAPARFDTRFFLAHAKASCEASPSSEFAWARFERPAEVLARWRRLELLLSPPTRFALEVIELGLEEAPRRLLAIPEAVGEESVELEAIPGIRALPLRTPTLPPARHTNAYLIGDERMIVVDPATYEEEEREVLLEHLEHHANRGTKIDAVVLTHHHADHVGAAAWVRAKLGVPILAHAITRELLAPSIPVDRTLAEGDVISLGGGFELGVLHTPGHAPGHLVLVDRRPGARAMIAGDMVAGVGTIIVDPPEGNMAEYLRQLRRLRAMPNAVLFPAHGQPLADGHAKLDEYVAHRLMREAKIFAALSAAAKPAKPADLLEKAYDDTPAQLYPLAARSCLAHLEKLVEDGRASRSGDRFTVR